jgi:hypothetical protein
MSSGKSPHRSEFPGDPNTKDRRLLSDHQLLKSSGSSRYWSVNEPHTAERNARFNIYDRTDKVVGRLAPTRYYHRRARPATFSINKYLKPLLMGANLILRQKLI